MDKLITIEYKINSTKRIGIEVSASVGKCWNRLTGQSVLNGARQAAHCGVSLNYPSCSSECMRTT